jgi:8-amino-7-oxononanoate synthase
MRSENSISGHSILDRIEEELNSLRTGSLYRYLDASRQWDFCSNDYLGLASHPELIGAVGAAANSADKAGSTGSRLLSGHHRIWEDLENQFARFLGCESALYFGSGYAANVGLLSSIARREDTVYSDASNHASLIDGIRLSGCRKVVFPHLDLDFLDTALGRNDGAGEKFIVVESLFSMDGDRTPIEELALLADRHGAGLIVDEAHAVGVYGTKGRGLIPDNIRRSDVLIAAVYTCGKALASPGAFVAGSQRLIDFLVNSARTFIFSTALPPYIAGQVSAALKLASAADPERAQLIARSDRLRRGLSKHKINTGHSNSQIVPVIIGSNEKALAATESLARAGFSIRPIRPPTVPEGTARLRLSVTADTDEDSIDRLVKGIAELESE